MNFRIGQQIVCIPADNGRTNFIYKDIPLRDNFPVVGQVYTVRGFDGVDGLLLEEIHDTRQYSWPIGGEVGFSEFRFKPVEPKQYDISVFQKMLLPKKSKVKA